VSGARRRAVDDQRATATATAGAAARAVAWRILRDVHRDGSWTGPAVDRALRGSGLDARDRALASNLAFQALRWEGTLDWALAQVVRRPLTEVEDGLHDVLRIGAWQLLYGRMPDRAAVSATVDVARSQVGPRTVGFANGVLRGLARRRSTLPWPADDTVEGRALRTGYPPWVVDAATARFGVDADEQLEAGNRPPDLTLRVTDPVAVRQALTALGADVRAGRLAPEALRVEGVAPGQVLESVPDAVIQDEASMVVGRVAAAAVPDGARMLDVCAAPGGKATHLAQLGRRVVAADRSAVRLTLVAALARRIAAPLSLAVADGTRPPWRPRTFDGVLLDAPCSGLGTVRRRPELRWRRDAADVASLATLQRELLGAAADLVGSGGALIYSVCTWTRDETTGVVEPFLRNREDFAAERVTVQGPAGALDGQPWLQLTPAAHGCDGMFIAVLRRTAGAAPGRPDRR
jgi:16S rRNA (cytosine967-C5)-methyltransferase